MKRNLGLLSGRARRGASVLIAILVFLLAALSGTVALTMSASNAGRYAHEIDDQQAYLYCASAAKLILNRLDGLTVTFRSEKQSAPVSSDEVEVILDAEKKDLILSDGDPFLSMLKDYAMNTVMNSVEFSLYLDGEVNNKVIVNIQRYGSNFNFDFWVQNGSERDYQMRMSQILAAFDEDEIVGGNMGRNFKENPTDGHFYRYLKFDVKGATFTVGNLKGGTDL